MAVHVGSHFGSHSAPPGKPGFCLLNKKSSYGGDIKAVPFRPTELVKIADALGFAAFF
jgi:hypothetical protein